MKDFWKAKQDIFRCQHYKRCRCLALRHGITEDGKFQILENPPDASILIGPEPDRSYSFIGVAHQTTVASSELRRVEIRNGHVWCISDLLMSLIFNTLSIFDFNWNADGKVTYITKAEFCSSNDFVSFCKEEEGSFTWTLNRVLQTQMSTAQPRKATKSPITGFLNALRRKKRRVFSSTGEMKRFNDALYALQECINELQYKLDNMKFRRTSVVVC